MKILQEVKESKEGGNKGLAVVMVKFENMDRRKIKMGQFIHAIQVGCDNCSGPHLTKDCDIDENMNRKTEALLLEW